MKPTEKFIETLASLKSGDLGRLRQHANTGLDESVDGFDLFAGVWWPLREKYKSAPRRPVAWLVAKLYACCAMPHAEGATLASQLGKLRFSDEHAKCRHQQKFDAMLVLSLDQIEPPLLWALRLIAANGGTLDWVRLTDQLSIWEHETTRLEWAKEFLNLAD